MVQVRRMTGEPIAVGGVTIYPESRALVVRLPFGGFVWHRPTSVVVQRAGSTERIPIVDVTRVAQVGLLVGTLVLMLVSLRKTRQSRASVSA